jgi:hypothetical protein
MKNGRMRAALPTSRDVSCGSIASSGRAAALVGFTLDSHRPRARLPSSVQGHIRTFGSSISFPTE